MGARGEVLLNFQLLIKEEVEAVVWRVIPQVDLVSQLHLFPAQEAPQNSQ